jgi:hypothetical protein
MKEKIKHSLAEEGFLSILPPHVRTERLGQCLSFIHRCEMSASRDDDYENCLIEIMRQAASSYSNVVKNGSIRLARDLPLSIDKLEDARKIFKDSLTRLPKSKRQKTMRGNEGNSKDCNAFVAHFLAGKFWNCDKPIKMRMTRRPDYSDVNSWESLIIKELRKRCNGRPVQWRDGHPEGMNVCILRPFHILMNSGKVNSAFSMGENGRKIFMRIAKDIPLLDAMKTHQWRAIRCAVRQSLKTIAPKFSKCGGVIGGRSVPMVRPA